MRILGYARASVSSVGVCIPTPVHGNWQHAREHVHIHAWFEFRTPADRVLTPAALKDWASFRAAGVSTRSCVPHSSTCQPLSAPHAEACKDATDAAMYKYEYT